VPIYFPSLYLSFTYYHISGKWIGACNDQKRAVDLCFRKEKERKRDLNLIKAREFEKQFEDYMKTPEGQAPYVPKGK
jgi:hypothetical protein